MESLTEPASPAPALPLSPDVPSTINSQIEPIGSPHPASIDEALSLSLAFIESNTTRSQRTPAKAPNAPSTNGKSGLPIAPKLSNMTRGQIAPVNTPLPAQVNIAPAWPITSNASGAVRYQMAPPRPAVVPQQYPASIGPQYMMRPVYPNPRMILPSSVLPRLMRAVECSVCRTKTLTDAYNYVDCSNPNCNRRICLLDNCFKGVLRLWDFTTHQNREHLANANPFQCYSCKAPKQRGRPDVATDTCSVCGVNWCLVGNCTYETPTSGIHSHIGLKHNIYQ